MTKSRRTRRLIAGDVLVLAGLLALPAHAVLVIPGDTVTLEGTTFSARPDLNGPVLDHRWVPFSVMAGADLFAAGSVELTLRSRAEELVVFYRINLDPGPAYVAALSSEWLPIEGAIPPIDADFMLDGPVGAAPLSATAAASYGSVVFNFEPGFQGGSSREMYTTTGSDLWQFGYWGASLRLADGLGHEVEIPFPTYGSFIPEPSAWLLTLLGLGIVLRRRLLAALRGVRRSWRLA